MDLSRHASCAHRVVTYKYRITVHSYALTFNVNIKLNFISEGWKTFFKLLLIKFSC